MTAWGFPSAIEGVPEEIFVFLRLYEVGDFSEFGGFGFWTDSLVSGIIDEEISWPRGIVSRFMVIFENDSLGFPYFLKSYDVGDFLEFGRFVFP